VRATSHARVGGRGEVSVGGRVKTGGCDCVGRLGSRTRRIRKRGLGCVDSLHVEYAERWTQFGILFRLNLFCEHIHLEYVRVPVLDRVHQAEYGILRVKPEILLSRRGKAARSGCARVDSPSLFSETNKHSPNTGTRANNTLHVTRPPNRGAR